VSKSRATRKAPSARTLRNQLKNKVAEFPRRPGVYLLKDAKGVVLYVGKAKSLRARVRGYFQEHPSDTRRTLPDLMGQVADVETIEAESEVDALLMEARLIKDIQPYYNARMRDDKLYPYLEITRNHDFPSLQITRRRDNPASKFYGPFTDTRGLRRSVQLLQPVFRFRTCMLEISAGDARRRFRRPCLLYYIERCTAPCADLVDQKDYRKQIALLQRFLAGKRKGVLASLAKEMKASSEALQFEKAARLRDQIKALGALGKRGKVDLFPEATPSPVVDPMQGLKEIRRIFGLRKTPRTIDGVDISHLSGADSVGSVAAFVDGKPFKAGYRRFRIKSVAGIDDFAMIGEIVTRRFKRLAAEKAPFPDILLVDGGKGQLGAALAAFGSLNIRPPKVISIAKREEILYHGSPPCEVRLKRNALALRLLQYVRDEAHRFAVHYHHILRGKRIRAEI